MLATGLITWALLLASHKSGIMLIVDAAGAMSHIGHGGGAGGGGKDLSVMGGGGGKNMPDLFGGGAGEGGGMGPPGEISVPPVPGGGGSGGAMGPLGEGDGVMDPSVGGGGGGGPDGTMSPPGPSGGGVASSPGGGGSNPSGSGGGMGSAGGGAGEGAGSHIMNLVTETVRNAARAAIGSVVETVSNHIQGHIQEAQANIQAAASSSQQPQGPQTQLSVAPAQAPGPQWSYVQRPGPQRPPAIGGRGRKRRRRRRKRDLIKKVKKLLDKKFGNKLMKYRRSIRMSTKSDSAATPALPIHVSSKVLVGSPYETKDQASFLTSTSIKSKSSVSGKSQ